MLPRVQARREVPPALRRLAEMQAGVLSREQVLGLGLSSRVIERLIASDRWRRLARGIYLTVPSEPSWSALAWGGVLAGGPGARLGPRASGHLHRLIEPGPDPVDVLVPAASDARSAGPWQFIRERPGARSPRAVSAPPRLSVEATVLDLCASSTEGEVVGLITTAMQRRLTTPRRLSEAMEARSRQRHRRLIAVLINDVSLGAESVLEVSYLRTVERPHGLPKGTRQQSRHGLRYLSDVGYDEYAVLVELDGRAGHEGVGRFRDMNRDNRFAALGWVTFRYGWFDVVERPCSVARQVGTVLSARRWPSPLRRCPRCTRLPE
jgi:very-short-patch-repair endonuclease